MSQRLLLLMGNRSVTLIFEEKREQAMAWSASPYRIRQNNPNILLAINVNKLPQYVTTGSPSWWVIELFAEENRADAVSNDSEIADEVFPYLVLKNVN